MFIEFKKKLHSYYISKNINKTLPSDNFLYWLVGFAEGDGCFLVNNRNELSFILVQGIPNKILLERIHTELSLGHIIHQNQRVLRLIIQKKDEIELIIYLFNGNMVLPSKKIQFNKFFTVFLQKNKHIKLSYINNKNQITLDNTWLLGFVEAEGSFTVSLINNSLAFRTRFIVSQKGDINLPVLSRLILIFNAGTIEAHHIKDNYSYIVSGLTNVLKIYIYFDKFLENFVGIKKQSYLKFKQLNSMFVNKDHLNSDTRKIMLDLAKDVNSAYRKFK